MDISELQYYRKIEFMKIKFIQINIYMGKYLRDLINFLNHEKPDIVTMEEVSTNKFNLWVDQTISLFDTICRETGLRGVYEPAAVLRDNPSSTLGNAVISRFDTVEKESIVLKKFRPMTIEEYRNPEFAHLFPKEEKHLLDSCLSIERKNVHVMSWHGAWVMNAADSPESIRQAEIVASHLKIIKEPFVLGGDLNVGPETKTVGIINKAANNLMTGSGIVQTTHPTVHKIAPKGYLIDYIFASSDFKAKSLKVPKVVVSDHLPVICELEL